MHDARARPPIAFRCHLSDKPSVRKDFGSPEWLAWEREVVARARTGDRRAMGELYEAFAPSLFREQLLPRLGNRAAAEDALSETFTALVEHLANYEDTGKSLWFWLVRVAVNKATDVFRSRSRGGRNVANLERMLAPVLATPLTPVEQYAEAERTARLRARITAVLDSISPRYKQAIVLRILQEHPRDVCAKELGVTVATFDVVLLRSLRAFRAELEDGGPVSSERGAS